VATPTIGAGDDGREGAFQLESATVWPKMPVVKCPKEGCKYEAPDVDPVIAAALITTHATSHQPISANSEGRESEKTEHIVGQYD